MSTTLADLAERGVAACAEIQAGLREIEAALTPMSTSASPTTVTWLAGAVREAFHLQSDELVTLEDATSRLYPAKKRTPWKDSIRWCRWENMRKVYEKTKGQPFVLDPDQDLLDAAGVTDIGPLFQWAALWRFAGCPTMDRHGHATTPPTWRPSESGIGIAFWQTASGNGRATVTLPWVTKLRDHQRRRSMKPGRRSTRG